MGIGCTLRCGRWKPRLDHAPSRSHHAPTPPTPTPLAGWRRRRACRQGHPHRPVRPVEQGQPQERRHHLLVRTASHTPEPLATARTNPARQPSAALCSALPRCPALPSCSARRVCSLAQPRSSTHRGPRPSKPPAHREPHPNLTRPTSRPHLPSLSRPGWPPRWTNCCTRQRTARGQSGYMRRRSRIYSRQPYRALLQAVRALQREKGGAMCKARCGPACRAESRLSRRFPPPPSQHVAQLRRLH